MRRYIATLVLLFVLVASVRPATAQSPLPEWNFSCYQDPAETFMPFGLECHRYLPYFDVGDGWETRMFIESKNPREKGSFTIGVYWHGSDGKNFKIMTSAVGRNDPPVLTARAGYGTSVLSRELYTLPDFESGTRSGWMIISIYRNGFIPAAEQQGAVSADLVFRRDGEVVEDMTLHVDTMLPIARFSFPCSHRVSGGDAPFSDCGVSFANQNAVPVTVFGTVKREDGSDLGTFSLQIPPFNQRMNWLSGFSPVPFPDFTGTVDVTATLPILPFAYETKAKEDGSRSLATVRITPRE